MREEFRAGEHATTTTKAIAKIGPRVIAANAAVLILCNQRQREAARISMDNPNAMPRLTLNCFGSMCGLLLQTRRAPFVILSAKSR